MMRKLPIDPDRSPLSSVLVYGHLSRRAVGMSESSVPQTGSSGPTRSRRSAAPFGQRQRCARRTIECHWLRQCAVGADKRTTQKLVSSREFNYSGEPARASRVRFTTATQRRFSRSVPLLGSRRINRRLALTHCRRRTSSARRLTGKTSCKTRTLLAGVVGRANLGADTPASSGT